MEKVKAFVIKHQLWFKLAAIALLVGIIFAPYIFIRINNGDSTTRSFWDLSLHIGNAFTDNYDYDSLHILSCIIVLFSFSECLLIAISLLKPKTLFTILVIFIVDFILMIALLLNTAIAYNNDFAVYSIPHIAFFLALILLIVDIIILWQLHKSKRTTERTVN